MKLSDLKTGMIVTIRRGDELVVFKDYCVSDVTSSCCQSGIICNAKERTWTTLENFNEEMNCTNSILGADFDIMKVEAVSHPYSFSLMDYEKEKRKTLWSAIIKEVTMAEIEAHFGCKVKIVKED